MKEDNLTKIKSNQVLELIRVAHEFNIYTESIAKNNIKEVLSFYQKILPLLYLKGSLLPDIEVSDASYNERYVNEEHWQNIYMVIKEKIGKDDIFWTLNPSNDAIKSSIAEIVADIYQDTKDFVVLFQKNSLAAKENAVSEMKRLFAVHWGPGITSILPELHKLLHSAEIKEYEESLF